MKKETLDEILKQFNSVSSNLKKELKQHHEVMKKVEKKFHDRPRDDFGNLIITDDIESYILKLKTAPGNNEDKDNSEYWKHYDERNKMDNDETYKD